MPEVEILEAEEVAEGGAGEDVGDVGGEEEDEHLPAGVQPSRGLGGAGLAPVQVGLAAGGRQEDGRAVLRDLVGVQPVEDDHLGVVVEPVGAVAARFLVREVEVVVPEVLLFDDARGWGPPFVVKL